MGFNIHILSGRNRSTSPVTPRQRLRSIPYESAPKAFGIISSIAAKVT
jgi:hypothetical protein